MPKEICQFRQTETAAGLPIADATSVEVRWSKPEGGGNLQLRFQRYVSQEFRDSGVQEYDQYTDQLSRDDCNRMIRALRRARDQVYGVDA